ncbi:hypothetical protein C0992_002831 [Termitomyces sp. T32_za158]|nr:hypothetical protein C0992_002831 [Termitomyces sp. T32_za158]
MISLFATVDAAPNPERSRCYVTHITGEAIDVSSKKTCKIENRARHWMVDEAQLTKEENIDFDNENCIAESRTLWRNAEDPEEAATKRAKIKETKKAIAAEKKRRMAEGNVKKAKKAKHGGKNKIQSNKVPINVAGPSQCRADDQDIDDDEMKPELIKE